MTAEPRVESISSRGRIGADHKGAKASRIIGAMRGVRDVRREQKLTRSLAWEKGEGPPMIMMTTPQMMQMMIIIRPRRLMNRPTRAPPPGSIPRPAGFDGATAART